MDRSCGDQEVGAEAGEADQQQRGVVAQVARLDARAPRPSRARTSPLAPPTSAPLTNTRSNVVGAKRPSQAAGRTNSSVDRLVEVPLVDEERVQRARSAPGAAPALCRRDPER